MIPARDLGSPSFKADPFPFYARLRAEAPVYRTRFALWLRAWLVMRYDDALLVLKDERFSKDFVSRIPLVPRPIRALTENVLNMDPPDHTRLRTLVNKAFTPRVVERMRGRIQAVCDELLDAAATAGHVDLVGAFALPLPLTMIAELLGIPAGERRHFAAWSKGFVSGTSGNLRHALPAWLSMWRFGNYFRGLVKRRRAEPGDDLVTALAEVEEAGDKLTEAELIAMLGLLLFAGYETTVNLIASGALALLEHPSQRELLRSNPGLGPSAVEELLRYTSPADFSSPRLARCDLTLAGTRIAKGSLVMAGLGSANRDETQFKDPDRLDITRDPNRHLAFGMGSHFCVGAPLARVEGQIALTTLFRRFPELRLEHPVETLRWRRGLLFRGLEALPVRLA